MATKIMVSTNRYTIVDDEDFKYLNKFRWTLRTGYAGRRFKGKTIFLHRVINNTPEGLFTDHINKDILDNRKCNLRTADKKLNGINRNAQINSKSGVKNVIFHKASNLWTVEVHFDGKRTVKYFKDIKEAIKQCTKIRKEVYGLSN